MIKTGLKMTKTTSHKTMTAAEAKLRFAESLRLAEAGDVVEITRYGKPVAAIIGIRQLEELERASRPETGLATVAGRRDDGEAWAEEVDLVVHRRASTPSRRGRAPRRVTGKGKMVRRRMKQATETATAASTFADLLARALAHALGVSGELTIGEAARRIAARLGVLRAAMAAAATAESRAEDLMRVYRGARDEAAPELYRYLTRIRQFARGFFGRKAGDAFLGLHGPTPEDPQELYDLAAEIIDRTADPAWPRPAATTRSVDFDPQGVARDLTERRDALGDALDALDATASQLAVAKAARNRATQAFDAFHGKGGRFLESGLELAGLDELVAQVRPGVGRRGRPPKTIASPGRPQLDAGTLDAGTLDAGAEDPELLLAEVSEPEAPEPEGEDAEGEA